MVFHGKGAENPRTQPFPVVIIFPQFCYLQGCGITSAKTSLYAQGPAPENLWPLAATSKQMSIISEAECLSPEVMPVYVSATKPVAEQGGASPRF